MSHISDVKLRIKDLDCLEEAGALCDFELRRNQVTHEWYGVDMQDSNLAPGRDRSTFGKCSHALRLKDHKAGDYEIGVVSEPDGSFSLLYDSWGGSGRRLEAAAGPQLAKLRREYACATATKKARASLGKKGFQISREDLLGGGIRLKLRKR